MDGFWKLSTFILGQTAYFQVAKLLVDTAGYVSLISKSKSSRMGGEEFNWAYATLQVKVKAACCCHGGRMAWPNPVGWQPEIPALTKPVEVLRDR